MQRIVGADIGPIDPQSGVDGGLDREAAWWLSRYMATLLFGVKRFDVVTYAVVAVLLLATSLAACYWPGRRAMRTDAAVALRSE